MPNEYLSLLEQDDRPQGAAPQPGNPYATMLEDEDALHQRAMQSSLTLGVDQNPDELAKQKRVARLLGTPVAAVQALPQDANRAAAIQRVNTDTAQAPVLKQKYTDADFAALAHDDSANLSEIERLLAAGSYLGRSLLSGFQNLNAAGAKLVDAVNPFTLSEQDAAVLFKDNPAKLKQMREQSLTMGLSRFANWQNQAASDTMAGVSPAAKKLYSDLRYATLDPSEAAYLSPVKVVGDAIQSLPTTAALALTVYLTKGAATRAESKALAGGATADEAKQAAIQAAVQVATKFGAASEGAAGYAQQALQTQQQIEQMPQDKLAASPEYQQLVDSGFDPAAARLFVAARAGQESGIDAGLIDAATNLVGGHFLGKIIGENGGVLKRTAKGFANEGITETVQSAGEQFAQNAAIQAHADPTQSLSDGVLESAMQGLVVGGLTGAGFAGVLGSAERRQRDAQQAEQAAQRLDQFNKLVAANKLLQRDPETFEDFITAASENGPVPAVFIDAQALAQSGVAREVIAASPAVREQFDRALVSGGQIAIPTGDYAANLAGTELAQPLLDHLRTSPNGMSRVEAQTFMQEAAPEFQAEVERVLTEQHADDAFRQGAENVRQSIQQQLDAAGRFSPDVNNAYASIMSSFFAVTAAKMGIAPSELYDRYPVGVGAQRFGGEALDQGAVSLDDVRRQWDDAGVDHFASEKNGVVTLSKLVVPEDARGEGLGTAAMQALADYADRTGQRVALSPSADFGGNKKRLTEFYKRFGFRENKGKTRDDSVSESMVRDPQRFGQSAVISAATPERQARTLEVDEVKNALKQGEQNRGAFDPSTLNITLLQNADLSTFLHEAGHFFLTAQMDIAALLEGEQRDGRVLSAGEQSIVDDAHALLKWFGVRSLDDWHAMTLDEQRDSHENFARGFEAYLFTGKAPSIELHSLFQRMRAWLVNIYKSLRSLNVNLTPEVTGVMDRMLASTEEIQLAEQARSMLPLIDSAEVVGWTPEEFAAYQSLATQQTADAIEELQARGLRDMKWLSNARSRELKRLQREAKEARTLVQMDVRREVMSQPVYRAWQFLTAKIGAADKLPKQTDSNPGFLDETEDSLLVAVAKLGGVDKAEVMAEWGVDPKDKPKSGVFGKPVWRLSGGLPLDVMAERLGERGYLPTNEHGQVDLRDFEERFTEELRGNKQYSVARDYEAEAMQEGQPQAPVKNPAGLNAGRLDAAELDEWAFPDGVVEAVKKRRMTARNGLPMDIVAEMFGFSSGDEMVRTLAEAAPPSEEIEALTDVRMLEQHGDLATADAIERAADQAVHNEARAKMVATEANALAKAARVSQQVGTNKAGKPVIRNILPEAAKKFAAEMISRLKVRDIRPDQFAAAGARAGRNAAKAMKSGDLAVAAAEKRNQVIQTYATRAAHEARAEVSGIDKFFREVVSKSDAKVGKTRDLDIVNAARAVLGMYGYEGKAKAAGEYLKSVEAYDPDMAGVLTGIVQAAESVAAGVKFRNGQPNIRDLTLDQLRALRDEVGSLWHLAKSTREMEVAGDKMDIDDAADALRARLEEIGVPNSGPGEEHAVTPREALGLKLAAVMASARRVESWVDLKDGLSRMGVWRRIFWQPVKDAADRYRAEKGRVLREFRGLFDAIGKTMKRGEIAAPELGPRGYTFGKDSGGIGMNELLHALLHTGNESNKRKLLLGRKWATETQDGQVDTRQWDAFIQRMVDEGRLTHAHFEFAQGVWDLLESLKPAAQKAHRDAYGKYFDEVTANAFTVRFPDGTTQTYRGGYVPAQVDSRIVADMQIKKLVEEGKDSMVYAFPGTSKGFTKGRVEYNRPLMLDLRTLAQHVDKVLLFSHLETPVRSAARVLANKGLHGALTRQDPAAVTSMLMPWLHRTARQQVTTPVVGDGGTMRMLNTLRNRTGMAAMMGNVSNAAQQVTGFFLAGLKVRPASLLSATAEYLKSPREMTRHIAEVSPYMANRMSSEVDAMLGEIQGVLLDPTLYERAQEFTKRHTYFLQQAVDNIMGPIIWTGAYNEALEAGESVEDAIRLGDAAVRQTQGSTLPEDVSRVETGNALMRMFMQFAGYFNMQANLLGTEFGKVAQEMGLRKGMGRGFYVLLVGFYATAIVSEMIAQAFRGGPGDDDRDGEYLDDWLMACLVYGPIRNLTAFVPGAGQAVNAMLGRFTNNPNDDRMSLAPVVSSIERAAGVASDVYKEASDAGNAKRTVNDVATLISLTTGLPANLAARPVGYLAGVGEGRIDPTGPGDMARGLVTGSASPESVGR